MLGLGGPTHSVLCLVHFLSGLLQGVLYKTTLEDYLEVMVDPECGKVVKSAAQYTHVVLWPQYIANCTDCYSPAGHIL